MSKIIGAELPFFLPSPLFFLRLACSSEFMIADLVDFSPRSPIQRTQIKIHNKRHWLTVPVHGASKIPLNQIRIDQHGGWQNTIVKNIRFAFKESPYFHEFYPELVSLFKKRYEYLSVLNMALISWLVKIWQIPTSMVLMSERFSQKPSGDLIISVCRELNGDTYMVDDLNRDFVNPGILTEAKIGIASASDYMQFVPLELTFDPQISSLELLFDHGPMARILFQYAKSSYGWN